MAEMSKMQEVIIDKFIGIVGKRTFTDYAELLGIERTRIFRIFNGVEMKIGEYEKMNIFIAKYAKHEKVDHDFFEKMSEVLSPELQKKWEIEVQRKHNLKRLLKAS